MDPHGHTRPSPWLIQCFAVRIQTTALILHFALMLEEHFFCLDNPAAVAYIDIHNDY